MSLSNVYTAGLNNVGSYQVSGAPFASGSISATSATKIQFPYVTQWVTVINHSSTHLKAGFSEAGVDGDNYFRCGPETGAEGTQSITVKVKVSEMWFSGSNEFDIVAGLTNIPVQRVNNIGPSGNNWSGSVGVG
jgi:hypothetical protein